MIQNNLPVPSRLPSDLLQLLTILDQSIMKIDLAEKNLNLVMKLSSSDTIIKLYPFHSETLLDTKTDLLKIREFYRQEFKALQLGGNSNTARMLQNATKPSDYSYLDASL